MSVTPPPVLQWAVSLMAGSQREPPETLRGGKDRESPLYLFKSRTCEYNLKTQNYIFLFFLKPSTTCLIFLWNKTNTIIIFIELV